MRRALLLALGLAWALSGPVASQQRSSSAALPAEPAPILAGRPAAPGEYSSAFDAVHYDIRLTLPITGSVIEGSTDIQIALTAPPPDTLALDFTGLSVTAVRVNGEASRFTQDAGKLNIPLTAVRGVAGSRFRVSVDYRGTPDDGLIIRNNVYGQPAVFADNWPNRARFWFPALDYPSDKATAAFTVLAPPGWQVVANGLPAGSATAVRLRDGTTRQQFRWRIGEPISPYNMVVGAANFRVQRVGRPCLPSGRCVDVTTWLFPESADKAAPSFRRAAAMLEYFSRIIAPFPYEKLAHVQSSTRYGGMENATAIFYDERALAEGRNIERTVAHETAHQWFGDAVTEAEWPHLWLSEGFATYFSALFAEHADGVTAFRTIMEADRRRIVASERKSVPVVDTNQQDLFGLLNVENYSKGSWVLHMLRGLLGDDRFFDGIRRYYRAHEHRTSLTIDVEHAMEAASGMDLFGFFDQWLFRPGFPRFRVSSQWNADRRTSTITVEQVQSPDWPTFTLPVTLELSTATTTIRQRVDIDERTEHYEVPVDSPLRSVVLAPDGWVLKDIVTSSQP